MLDAIDKRAQAPAAVSLQTPPAPVQEDPKPPGSSAPAEENETPLPYAGKFDPKAIAKKASWSSTSASKLGTDVSVPQNLKASATSKSNVTTVKANKPVALANGGAGQYFLSCAFSDAKNTIAPAPIAPLKAKGNVSGFGLSSKGGNDVDKSTAKRGLDFEEEEGSRKKLEKLPTPPLESNDANENETSMANGMEEDNEDDEDGDIPDGATEEEAAAAARAAAEKREERLQEQNITFEAKEESEAKASIHNDTKGDVMMTEVPAVANGTVSTEEPEEEVDELDAFMSGLGDPLNDPKPRKDTGKSKAKHQQPQAIFGDDEVDLDTVKQDPDDFLSMASKKKKKDIPTVNHGKMAYQPLGKHSTMNRWN